MEGVFPQRLKESIVCPIFKAGDRADVNCYRPISLISTMAKIYEICLKTRLVNFFDKNKVLSMNQYGFRSAMSTSDAILRVINEVTDAINSDQKPLAVFLDLKKAFDTVSHEILLKRLHSYGVRGAALELFSSYLKNRSQRVRVNGVLSDVVSIEFGVPQGTVLGPILFLAYINPLCKLEVDGAIVSFADDTVLLVAGPTWDEVQKKAEVELRKIMNWLDGNLLTLNLDKTHFICFSPTIQGQPNFGAMQVHRCRGEASCKCQMITKQSSLKYLGIIVDSFLRWDDNICKLCQRLRKTIYIFKRLREVVSVGVMKMVYYSLVQSLISYGIVAWGGSCGCYLDPLIRVQKLILKVICKKPPRYSTEQLFEEFRVKDVRQLYAEQILIKVHKNRSNMTARIHQYGTRNRHHILSDVARKAIVQRHFNYLGPKLFNLLPCSIINLPTLQFKTAVGKWVITTGRENIDNIICRVIQ